jgi:hypothetical protein
MKSPTPLNYSNAGRIEKEAGLITETFPVKEEDNSNVKKDRSSSPIPILPAEEEEEEECD